MSEIVVIFNPTPIRKLSTIEMIKEIIFLRNRNTFLEKREMSKAQNIDETTVGVLYIKNVMGKLATTVDERGN